MEWAGPKEGKDWTPKSPKTVKTGDSGANTLEVSCSSWAPLVVLGKADKRIWNSNDPHPCPKLILAAIWGSPRSKVPLDPWRNGLWEAGLS